MTPAEPTVPGGSGVGGGPPDRRGAGSGTNCIGAEDAFDCTGGAARTDLTPETGRAAGHDSAPRNELGQGKRRSSVARLPVVFKMCEVMECLSLFAEEQDAGTEASVNRCGVRHGAQSMTEVFV